MADEEVLTEDELDALMDSVEEETPGAGTATGLDASDDGQYRRVDFAAREQSLLRQFTALTPLMERQAELLTAILEDGYSIEFAVRAQAPALVTVADLTASLERAVAVTTCRLNPLPGHCFTVAPASLLSFIVNAYFGGGMLEADPSRDALTPTEVRIAERLAEQQLGTLLTTWQDKLPLESTDLMTLGVPDRLEMLPTTDVLLRLTHTLSVGRFEGKADILIPFAALEPFQARFAPPRREQERVTTDSWEPVLRRELPGIEVELAAVLSARAVSLAELLDLKPGAILPLAPPEQVSLQVENATLAEGRYGSFEGLKAVQLQRLGNLERG